MSGAVEAECPRPRPLSGGLWTLLWWLRRDDHSSSDSLSSAGSDRTAASFAFLAPAHYGSSPPASRPPPGPPTDSYKKRVHDRNLRRQHDRDITLHRKYGLYGFGYDSLNLPSGRRAAGSADGCERERRAASESLRAHVPGKRRAPLPPAAPATLSRRRAKKRPAPPPPVILAHKETLITDSISDNKTPMSELPLRDETTHKHDSATGCTPEKYSKKDAGSKDVKVRHEKSFLKQIFDSRKRNSAIETASVKLLPSISELDQQAAEIIDKYRLTEIPRNDAKDVDMSKRDLPGSSRLQAEAWICTRCLKKYNATVITCNYCLPVNKINDSFTASKLSDHSTQTKILAGPKSKPEDKEKLKEILKEMKDNLPKRAKNEVKSTVKPLTIKENSYPQSVEAPTLRIGNPMPTDNKKNITQAAVPASSGNNLPSISTVSQEIRKDNHETSNKLNAGDLNEDIKGTNPDKLNRYRVVNNSNRAASPSKFIINNKYNENNKELLPQNTVIITQPVVLVHSKEKDIVLNETNVNKEELINLISNNKDNMNKNIIDNKPKNTVNKNEKEKVNNINEVRDLAKTSKEKFDLNTPLKISALLNPIYVPKNTAPLDVQATKHVRKPDIHSQESTNAINVTTNSQENKAQESGIMQNKINIPALSPPAKIDKPLTEQKIILKNIIQPHKDDIPQITGELKSVKKENVKSDKNVTTFEDKPSTSNGSNVEAHIRRRNLINQLERSIANGDEKAAAEAAVKLAQLRLSCSVLSFSSQIVAEHSTSGIQRQIPKSEMEILVGQETQKSLKDNTETVKVKDNTETVKVKDNTETVKVKDNTETVKIKDNITKDNDNTSKIEIRKETPPQKTTKLESCTGFITNIRPSNETTSISDAKIAQKTLKGEASTSKNITTIVNTNEDIPILVWVEDKEATRGPVQIHVRHNAVMGDLRRQAELSLGLAAGMQRWIVGRSLCTDDTTPLVTLAGAELTAPFYLCLVESDIKETTKLKIDLKPNNDAGNVYNELVKLEHQAFVPNAENFECGVCMEKCPPGAGVVLRECVHSFCRECLLEVVRHSEEPVVTCPAMGCRGVLQEREIRGLVTPEDYEKWLARGLAAAESGTRNAFHCRTRDCKGWALCEPGVRRFPCPVCKCTNCVPCQAIHEGKSCEEHRVELQQSASGSDAGQADEGTRALLDTLITRGEALECPECSAIITKKWGCDWVKCSACKTEICWVTKGRRWGPAGRGDTSGGCRCGLEGKRCHPSCGYCH